MRSTLLTPRSNGPASSSTSGSVASAWGQPGGPAGPRVESFTPAKGGSSALERVRQHQSSNRDLAQAVSASPRGMVSSLALSPRATSETALNAAARTVAEAAGAEMRAEATSRAHASSLNIWWPRRHRRPVAAHLLKLAASRNYRHSERRLTDAEAAALAEAEARAQVANIQVAQTAIRGRASLHPRAHSGSARQIS